MSLDDARAKPGRAHHIESLRAGVREVGKGEPYTIPLREELDEETSAVEPSSPTSSVAPCAPSSVSVIGPRTHRPT